MSDPDPAASSSTATAAAAQNAARTRSNPYVGPRPFRREELFYGREQEATSVVNSLLASRVMLLHSPSGAGKTSLIQASVVPAFEKRDFLICASVNRGFTALRVNLPPPPGLPVANRYVFSVVNKLVGYFTDRDRACSMTLLEAFDAFVHYHGSPRRQLIVFDQLEEVLTLDPGDLEGQTAFFQQLGNAFDDSRRWGLLAMREDYMGALDRFRQYLPGQLRSTFRLDLLNEEAALRAVVKPAEECGVEFAGEAAEMLVKDLALVHSGYATEEAPTVRYPYVEPVLLQVICYSLFKRLSKDPERTFDAITVKDVDNFRPFGKAIAKYYRGVIQEVASGDPAIERALRDWVEHHLISKRILRRQTREKPLVPKPNDPYELLSAMQSRYLIRDDPRPGGPPTWELSHDMLVKPILADNQAWRTKHLERWQCLAEDWLTSDGDEQYLLRGADYLEATSPRRRGELTDNEQAFLRASEKALMAEGRLTYLERRLSQLRARLGYFVGLLTASLLVNVALLVLILW